MGALRDLVAIVLLVGGPIALVVAGVVILVDQLEEPVAEVMAQLSGEPSHEVPLSVPVVAVPPHPEPVASPAAEPEPAATAEPTVPPPAAKKRLGRKDVAAVVKAGRDQLLACTEVARSRGVLKPGRLNLVLDFVVAADGGVEQARLLRPKKHRKTELALCVGAVVSGWRFPASEKRTPIKYPVVLRVERPRGAD